MPNFRLCRPSSLVICVNRLREYQRSIVAVDTLSEVKLVGVTTGKNLNW